MLTTIRAAVDVEWDLRLGTIVYEPKTWRPNAKYLTKRRKHNEQYERRSNDRHPSMKKMNEEFI